MKELPAGWAETTIGEVLQFNYGKGLPERDRSGSGFPVYGSNGVVGYHQQALVSAESLVIGRKGSVGEVHHSRGPCWPIDTTYFVDEFCGMPARFWYYAMKGLDLGGLNRATAIPGLNREDAYQVDVVLPPQTEQKRIADKLDALLARVNACHERLDRVPAILKRFRQAVLAAATSGKLMDEWRAEQRKSEEWQTLRLTDVGKIGRGKSKHRPRNDPRLYGGPYPFIQTGDVARSGERITTHTQTYSEFGLAQSKLWPAGTVCITIAANIADTAILGYPACFPDSVVGFVADPNNSLPEFIKWSIDVIRDRLEAFAPATAQKNINLAVLNDVEFRCPPIDEQREIVRRVEALFAYADRLEARYTIACAQVERLTPALLAKAFRGELVPQDPNDELASVLLERIRASRVAAGEKPPRKVRTERKPMTTTLTTG